MEYWNPPLNLCADDSFGPLVKDSCPRGTDLTLLFEEAALCLGPGIFMVGFAFTRMFMARAVHWWPQRKATTFSYWIKLVIYFFHLIHVTLLAVLHNRAQAIATTSQPCARTSVSFLADSTSVFAALFLILNTCQEESTTSWATSPRPITTYLMIGLISDLLRARTFSSACSADKSLGPGYLILGLLKLTAMVLEQFRKSHNLSNCVEDDSGVISRLFFGWLYTMIRKGYRTRLQIKDLPVTKYSIRIRSRQGIQDTILERSWSSSPYSTSRFALLRIIFNSFSSTVVITVILRLLLLIVSLAQPIIIRYTLKFVENSQNRHGTFLILGVILVYCGAAVLSGAYWHSINSAVTRLRGVLFAAIYRQALLSEKNEETDANGAVISLMSSDVDAVLQGFRWIHEIWATLITTAISLWMLYAEVGLAFLSPLVFTIGVTMISSYLSRYLRSLQQEWLQSTAERVEYTLYALRNMLGIKMSGMSDRISDVVLNYRHVEVERSKQFRKMLSLLLTLANVSTLGVTLATLGTFAVMSRYTGEELSSTKMFTALAILQLPMSALQTLISSAPLMAGAIASLQRIQEYLAQEGSRNVRPNTLILSDILGTKTLEKSLKEMTGVQTVFSIENGTIGWASTRPLLKNVSFQVLPSEICFILGQAGSGKSTLLEIISGGTLTLKFVISISRGFAHAAYCEQSPWLPNETIQNVIVGAERFESAWFADVISLCCLTKDIADLEKGIDTFVGTDGTGLSGGQKKRIALARAIYSRDKTFILDDPLSSLDANSENSLIENLLGPRGYFRSIGATVILATSIAKHLHYADRVYMIQGGLVTEHCAYEGVAAGSNDNKFYSEVHDQGNTSIIEEEDNNGAVDDTVQGHIHGILDTMQKGPQPKASMVEYKLYVSSIGRKNFVIFILLSAAIAAASLARSLELKRISQYYSHDAYNHLGVYISLVATTLMFILWWNWHFYIYGVGTSSTHLHKIQWDALIDSPMSFFTTTGQGEIMNSFTQDLRYVDKDLPTALSSASLVLAQTAIFLVIVNTLIAVMATKFTAFAAPFLAIAFWLVCRTYLRISFQIRLLDLDSASPVFNHAIETMRGIRTIRSFGWVDHFYTKFLGILDNSQRPYYSMFAIQQLLQVVLDLFVAIVAVITCLAAIASRSSMDTGMLGLTLTSLMTLGGSMKLFVRSWTDLETSIGAIGRINSFMTKSKSEHDLDGCQHQGYNYPSSPDTLQHWPNDGSVAFENFTAAFGIGKPPVIRNINLKIYHGERVAICGRSGSGKTSLVSSLFSLTSTISGEVLISNLPISNICVQKLRESIAGLPQDAFFLPGSVRDNFRIYHDRDSRSVSSQVNNAEAEDRLTTSMVGCLSDLGIYHKIIAAGGLDCTTISLTTLLSHGEKQLFNLARLSITSSPIVVMDEAASSIDDETERLARVFMRKRLVGKTIIGVVHRLGSLVEEDWDRYVLMDGGRITETGHMRESGRGEKFAEFMTGGGGT